MKRRKQLAGRKVARQTRTENGRSLSPPESGRRGENGLPLDSATEKKNTRVDLSLQAMKITDLYRPLKKPITLRLDADILAWFKKDGRRYQTRINRALRKVMERDMKSR